MFYNNIWFEPLRVAWNALFKKEPKPPSEPQHAWIRHGDIVYRYRLSDKQIRARIEPVEVASWRVHTTQGRSGVYIDIQSAMDAIEKAYP